MPLSNTQIPVRRTVYLSWVVCGILGYDWVHVVVFGDSNAWSGANAKLVPCDIFG